MKWIYWLKPGLQMKRWLLLGLAGIVMISAALAYFWRAMELNLPGATAVAAGLTGLLLLILSLHQGILSLMRNLDRIPRTETVQSEHDRLVQMVYDRQVLSKGRRIVVIGGGTGLSVLLRGMKQVTTNISAIVTVADDGGGSGVLREDLGMLPPGDIRSCLLALAEMEPTMEALLQYRFTEGVLKGQSFGNLFVASMNGISDSFEEAVKKMGEVLAVKGQVLPVTLEDLTLYAQLKNGKVIKGESNIPLKCQEENSPIDFVFIRPRKPAALPEVLTAIDGAEAIVLGPGSLYTSIIPNLLVSAVTERINQSKAVKIYLPNLMTQPGETDRYAVVDHVEALMSNTGLAHLDYVLANAQKVPQAIVDKYRLEGAEMVLPNAEDHQRLKESDIQLMEVNAVDIRKEYVRHDALTISRIIHDQLIPEKHRATLLHKTAAH
ncbi:gluconeogenesis factor YvcK family protein [Anoxynatronum buryatiense]|uniref:Putative gluconeogenesis factor n=2 Tax=Anoxynatronum TaxID=210622 RepID=A0AA46AI41_9CLOT|nr:gluconeogenesis factor YvcK family protein [Anoxynatronum buryatiense]SMP45454.1 conserved hypothetical protein, cofD-related [Anoxynatronum buryatiense]